MQKITNKTIIYSFRDETKYKKYISICDQYIMKN